MENKSLFKMINDNKLALNSFVFLFVSDLFEFLGGGTRLNINPTYICAIFKLISIIYLFKLYSKNNWKKEMPNMGYRMFIGLIIWNLITFLHGVFTAKDYWDWKFLIMNNAFNFLVPYAIILGLRFDICIFFCRFIIRKIFTYGLLLIPLSALSFWQGLYLKTMQPISLFALFGPYLKRKWLIIILVAAFFLILTGADTRANTIRIIVCILLILVYYLKAFVNKGIIKIVCLIFFLMPLVLFGLGVSNVFNIFKVTEDDTQSSSSNSELGTDTRTFLYAEVLQSMAKHDTFLLGEGGAGTYETAVFTYFEGDERGRYGAEVGFLNTLLYSGIIGVVFYLLILVCASYYAVNYSNNFLCKMLAVFLAARWIVFFIEDINKYDINFYFLWIAIGLCMSPKFRNNSDADIRNYFLSVTGGLKLNG